MTHLCVLLAFAISAASGSEQPDELAAKSRRARQAMAEGRLEDATALYRELVRALPRSAGLLMNLGLALHSAGRYAEAIEQFEGAVRIEPDLTPAWLMLGLAHQKLGQPARAVEPLTRALRREPANRIALLELADALLALGRAGEAAAHFRRLGELEPGNPKAWQGLGLSYVALARRAFEALEKSAPNSPYWYALLARSKAEERQYRTAFHLYKQALDGVSDLPGIHAALADIYRKTGHEEWAALEEARERALPKPKRRAPAAGTPEHYYEQATDYSQKALEAFSRLSLLPPTAEVHELLAEAYRIRRQHRQSVHELNAALKLNPGDRRLEKKLAESLWLNLDSEAAVPLLERLLREEPESTDLNYQLGDSLLQLGEAEKALPLLEKAVKLAPERLPAHASLAQAYLRSGRLEEAVRHFQIALPVDDDGSLRYQLALAYRRLGRSELAEKVLHEFDNISRAAQTRQRKSDEERQITAP
ncbi:MAG: tetratricopeptide repeat protein [Acidobacteriota bacterium]